MEAVDLVVVVRIGKNESNPFLYKINIKYMTYYIIFI